MKIFTTFVKPFGKELAKGRQRTLRHFGKKAGVYFIKEDGVIVYVGMSASCVVKACYRHFYPWSDCYRGMGREYRTTYFDTMQDKVYEIHIVTTVKDQAGALEKAMIISLQPRDNREKYEFYIETHLDNKAKEENTNLDNTNDDDDEFDF